MALVRCRECGAEISTTAKSCPQCGAGNKAMRGRPGCLKVGAIAIAVLFGISLLAGRHTVEPAGGKAADTPGATEETAGDKAKHSKGDDMAMEAAIGLKQSLRNPDSLVLERFVASPDGRTVCIAYRAQNGFGGMNREWLMFLNGKSSRNALTWRRRCHDDQLRDEMQLAQAAMAVSR